MGCKLTKNIKHTCDYNPGGILDIYLLDVRDFDGYIFQDDRLYDVCYVEEMLKTMADFVRLDTVNESAFTETFEKGIYKQELTSFIRTLEAEKTSQFLHSKANKYIVAYRTNDERAFTFGLDGGASIGFGQITGQLGESSGYHLTISKSSIYPQFEIDSSILRHHLLASEARELMVTEDGNNYVQIERLYNGRNK